MDRHGVSVDRRSMLWSTPAAHKPCGGAYLVAITPYFVFRLKVRSNSGMGHAGASHPLAGMAHSASFCPPAPVSCSHSSSDRQTESFKFEVSVQTTHPSLQPGIATMVAVLGDLYRLDPDLSLPPPPFSDLSLALSLSPFTQNISPLAINFGRRGRSSRGPVPARTRGPRCGLD